MSARASLFSEYPGHVSSGPSSSVPSNTSLQSSTASTSTASASTSRFSLPSTASSLQNIPSSLTSTLTSGSQQSKRQSLPVNILDRPAAKTRGSEVSFTAWAFLFSEIVQYTQRRVSGIADFEERLSTIGYRVGIRLIELLPLRDSLPPSTSRNAAGPPRQTRLLPVLQYVHTTLFRYLFGRPASSLERSTDNEDEYMIGDDDPVLDKGVQVPKEMSSLSTNALLAGIVEAVMDGLGFPSRVTSHLVPTDQHPRRTVLLIKLQAEVLKREQALAAAK